MDLAQGAQQLDQPVPQRKVIRDIIFTVAKLRGVAGGLPVDGAATESNAVSCVHGIFR